MSEGRGNQTSDILPVTRSKGEAKRFYDRVSGIYDHLSGRFEHRFTERAVELLTLSDGESVLELGFGTGRGLVEVAGMVGDEVEILGVDLSTGMIRKSLERLRKTGDLRRVSLCCSDALNLPYRGGVFDAVFMAFTLELFDTPEIPIVLREVWKVLRPGGRLGAASLSKGDGGSLSVRIYEWGHRRWPTYLDCRPIFLEGSMIRAGFEVENTETLSMVGLPVEVVVGVNLAACR
ncbi:MAG: methyltransferase domain-containing protein [Candidatus Bathyarchaeota archaeon]|nr:MAG: methyltransferase domain-containing protein [Candidatus Bathyarchaeota archaeon]